MALLEPVKPLNVIEPERVPQGCLGHLIPDGLEEFRRRPEELFPPRVILRQPVDQAGKELCRDRNERHVIDGDRRDGLTQVLQRISEVLIGVHRSSVAAGRA